MIIEHQSFVKIKLPIISSQTHFTKKYSILWDKTMEDKFLYSANYDKKVLVVKFNRYLFGTNL